MSRELFLDSSFAIALSVVQDRLHRRALQLATELEQGRISLVTTHAVLLEIGNTLSRQRYRRAAGELLESMQADPAIEIVPLAPELCVRAFRLFKSRPDKEWGLTDCVSFTVMQDRGIREALTADTHFEQAGFRTLLTE